MEKMIQIVQQLEYKEHKYLSSSNDPAEVGFLRRKEADSLFKYGFSYDVSLDLHHAQTQTSRSLEVLQRQIENERAHTKQMELGR